MDLTRVVGVFIYGIMMTLTTSTPEETESIAHGLAHNLPPTAIALVGTLGMGKTCFAKGFVGALGMDKSQVCSPTFSLLHEYDTEPPVLHLDVYRLESEELPNLGLEERIDDQIDVEEGFVLVEWADLHPQLMPENTVWIGFSQGETNRTLKITGPATVLESLERNVSEL